MSTTHRAKRSTLFSRRFSAWFATALLGFSLLLSSCATPFQSPCSYRFMLVPTQKQADELGQNRNLPFSCAEEKA